MCVLPTITPSRFSSCFVGVLGPRRLVEHTCPFMYTYCDYVLFISLGEIKGRLKAPCHGKKPFKSTRPRLQNC